MRVALAGFRKAAGGAFSTSRVIRLEAGDGATVRFLSALKVTLEEGKRTSWVTLTRTGRFEDPRYGKFEITGEMLLAMVANFDKRTFGQDIFIDVSHRPEDGAAAKLLKLTVERDRLRGQVEWTDFGIEAVTKKGYAYLSAEYHEDFKDNERGDKHGALLSGAALTIRPCIKRLDPIELSEPEPHCTLIHPELRTQFLQETTIMLEKYLKALREALVAKKLAEVHVKALCDAAAKALEGVSDEAVAKQITGAFETAGIKLSEQAPPADKAIEIKIDLPAGAAKTLSEVDVQKIIADSAKKLAEDQAKATGILAAKKKLLADSIGAAKDLDDAAKKELTEQVSYLITAELTDDQVKKLAATQIENGNKVVAARKLANLGYDGARAGNAHIQVDESNEVKKLQEAVDKRLGFLDMPAAQRFDRVGGTLPAVNKKMADLALAMYDREHGRRLHEEAKQLASGDSIVTDVAVPASFERTVIREALYNLVGLSIVDANTAQYAAVLQIPYSYRDTGAAGIAQARTYEGQAIRRAAVKQALHESRPIPQKLSFEVSDELRYLSGNGQLNWDVIGENARNASRIIGEDTESLIGNEHLNAADRFSTVAVTNEAVATANGTLKTFILDQFPVVRPQKVYDLQGNQVGSTLYPLTVTVNAVSRPEYDGTGTQAAGIYWIPNYNLGELAFVSELGVPTAPTNTHAIVASYTYTTNVAKFDTDLGALKVDEKYDDLLYTMGLRKEVIESQRSYQANIAIMSGTLRTSVERARQFSANYSRPGTNLTAEGNLGVVKGIPSFKLLAPGLAIGDVRMVIGERATVRFRMLKPWTMGALENQKDSNGRFTGKKEAYGDQFVIVDTPTPLRAAMTSIVVYSAAARVDRA